MFMKFRLILSILFVIATTLTALHELKHVEHHDSSTCQVCVVDNHSVSADIVVDFKDLEIFSFEAVSSNNLISYFYTQTSTNKTRAPPFLS